MGTPQTCLTVAAIRHRARDARPAASAGIAPDTPLPCTTPSACHESPHGAGAAESWLGREESRSDPRRRIGFIGREGQLVACPAWGGEPNGADLAGRVTVHGMDAPCNPLCGGLLVQLIERLDAGRSTAFADDDVGARGALLSQARGAGPLLGGGGVTVHRVGPS